MKVTKEKPHAVFGVMGSKVRVLECPSCGNIVERDWTPGKGYGLS